MAPSDVIIDFDYKARFAVYIINRKLLLSQKKKKNAFNFYLLQMSIYLSIFPTIVQTDRVGASWTYVSLKPVLADVRERRVSFLGHSIMI
jgi:accessory gene regulator protein AgrB